MPGGIRYLYPVRSRVVGSKKHNLVSSTGVTGGYSWHRYALESVGTTIGGGGQVITWEYRAQSGEVHDSEKPSTGAGSAVQYQKPCM